MLFTHYFTTMFRIEIHPVTVKTFDHTGSGEKVSHYIGFIYGLEGRGIKNLYFANTRREMIDQMFDTLRAHGISIA